MQNSSTTPPRHADILLHPGEWVVTSGPVVVHTLLGSCVALTLWDPHTRIGGMCHYLLPTPSRQVEQHEDGRYGTTVFARLLKALKREGVDPMHCEAKLFGGGNMLPSLHRQNTDASAVGVRNIEIARTLLVQHRIALIAENCGGFGHRTVLFELWSGHVWVRHNGSAEPRQHLQSKKKPEEANATHRAQLERTIKGT